MELLKDICRLCLKNDKSERKLSVFGKANDFKISDMIFACLNIKILEIEEYTTVCASCVLKIDQMFGWYSAFRANDRELKKFLKLPKSQKKVLNAKNVDNERKQLSTECPCPLGTKANKKRSGKKAVDVIEATPRTELVFKQPAPPKKKIKKAEPPVVINHDPIEIVDELIEAKVEDDDIMVSPMNPELVLLNAYVPPTTTISKPNATVKTASIAAPIVKTQPVDDYDDDTDDIMSSPIETKTLITPPMKNITFSVYNPDQKNSVLSLKPQDIGNNEMGLILPNNQVIPLKQLMAAPSSSVLDLRNDATKKYSTTTPTIMSNIKTEIPSTASKERQKPHVELDPPYEDPPNKCFICETIFETAELFEEHEPSHFADCPYYCDKCDLNLISVRNTNKHLAYHDINRPFKCDSCEKRFKSLSNKRAHYNFVHRRREALKLKEKNLMCIHCGVTYADGYQLKRHERTHKKERTTDKKFKCEICGLRVSTKSHLTRHHYIHTGERPYKCTDCDKSYTEKFYLDAHKEVHATYKPYECEACGKLFSNEKVMTQHAKTHNYPNAKLPKKSKKFQSCIRSFICPICQAVFNRNSECIDHLDNVHPEDAAQITFYHCESEDCDKKYIRRIQLQRHRWYEHRKKERVKQASACQFCAKICPDAQSLQYHELLHQDIKNFACHICGKKFVGQPHLNRHLQIHSDIKNFECQYCKKLFRKSDTLRIHLRTHTGEKPYACEMCDSRFGDPSTLIKHRKTHMRNLKIEIEILDQDQE